MKFIAWPEIEAFYNIRKYALTHPEILNGKSIVNYRGKCKLHGTNSAIQVSDDGTITCQSRSGIISPENDNAGFARWVMSEAAHWKNCKNYIIFGEWIGKGIQKNVAVSDIPQKSFAVFAAHSLLSDGTICSTIFDPEHLRAIVPPIAYVIPWYKDGVEIDIDWSQSSEELSKKTDIINEWVAAIEACDPWVELVFGIKGTGEGIVMYPYSKEHDSYEDFKNLCFKAKGEAHKNIATAKPAQASPEMAASVDAFVDMVLTPARLDQGVKAVVPSSMSITGPQLKLTGEFVKWIVADVLKESADELEASNLEWKDVQKPLSDKARAWYLAQAKK